MHLGRKLGLRKLLADYMLACAASKEEDRAVHLMSPLSSIKALRWLAKTVEWQALSQIMTSSVLSAYGTQSRAYDRKEAMPIPLALIVSWEELLCTQSTALTTKLFLRFGDAQRVDWWTLQLSAQGLHGTAYATKTTKCGQPFACTWHGLAGRDVQSSWLLQWLACLVDIGEHASIAPDFLFFHCDLESQQFPHTFPSSYSQALLCLRYMAQQAGLTAEETISLTLHSMKSTLLAAGAQCHRDGFHAGLCRGGS